MPKRDLWNDGETEGALRAADVLPEVHGRAERLRVGNEGLDETAGGEEAVVSKRGERRTSIIGIP